MPIKSSTEINLSNYEKKIYSQNGEDGIIKKIFDVVKPINKSYVEFGVENGDECNTRNLRINHRWNGLMLDGGNENLDIGLHREFITASNINKLFKKYKVPQKLDLLSIDIDYNDFYVLYSILNKNKHDIAVIVVEFNASVGLSDKIIIYDPMHMWDKTNYFGAGIYSYYKLFNHYGYTLIYCDQKGVNLFAVKTKRLEDNGISFINMNNYEKLYRPPNYGKNNTGHKTDYLNRAYIDYEQFSSCDWIKYNKKIKKIIIKKINKIINITHYKKMIENKQWDMIDELRKKALDYMYEKLKINKLIVYTLTVNLLS